MYYIYACLLGGGAKTVPRVKERGDQRLQRVSRLQETFQQPERLRAVPQR